MGALPRGICSVCGRVCAVRRGGEAREHRRRLDQTDPRVTAAWGLCPGSGLRARGVNISRRPKLRFVAKVGSSRSAGFPVHTVDPAAPRQTVCGLEIGDDFIGRDDPRPGRPERPCGSCDRMRSYAEAQLERVEGAS